MAFLVRRYILCCVLTYEYIWCVYTGGLSNKNIFRKSRQEVVWHISLGNALDVTFFLLVIINSNKGFNKVSRTFNKAKMISEIVPDWKGICCSLPVYVEDAWTRRVEEYAYIVWRISTSKDDFDELFYTKSWVYRTVVKKTTFCQNGYRT